MTPSETIMILLELGFTAAGETPEQIVRIPSFRVPVYGGLGGERRTLGGRARYVLPNTDLRATVGARTTNLYFSREGKVEFLLNIKTRELTPQQLRDLVTSAARSQAAPPTQEGSSVSWKAQDSLRFPAGEPRIAPSLLPTVFITLCHDRHADLQITVHATREGADRQIEEFKGQYTDVEWTWTEEDCTRSAPWVRYVSSDGGNGAHARIKEVALLP